MAKRRPAQRRPARDSTTKPARKTVARQSRRPAGRATKGAAVTPGWRTAVTSIEPNKILVRGYVLDEMMGRVSFGESVYLILTGELPSPDVGRLVEALLVSSIDHGVNPPVHTCSAQRRDNRSTTACCCRARCSRFRIAARRRWKHCWVFPFSGWRSFARRRMGLIRRRGAAYGGAGSAKGSPPAWIWSPLSHERSSRRSAAAVSP